MIRVTKQTDYGMLMLAHMGRRPNGRVHTARELTEETGLPGPMVSKILKLMARAGIIGSHRGVNGGYSLARPVEEISVANLIEALEGPIGMTTCSLEQGSCEHEACCPVQSNWTRISRKINETLERIPLSEMVGPPADPA
jgi:FeS assembly SUF system regulator